jgi:hypothetical protein
MLVLEYVADADIAYAIENNTSQYAQAADKTGKVLFNTTANKAAFAEKNGEQPEEPIKTLDNLFKKTETKPHLYYLPLTDEEVSNTFLIFIGCGEEEKA